MKKRNRKRWRKVGWCFLTATFLFTFALAHIAHSLASVHQAGILGYALCVNQDTQQDTTEYTGFTGP